MVQHITAMVPPKRGGFSPTQTAEGWWWPSTQIQALTATPLHVLIEQSKGTANLCSSGTARHPGLYLLTWAQSPSRKTAAILIFKALSAKPAKAKLSSLPRAQNAPLKAAFLSPPVLHSSCPTLTWILKQGTYPGRQYWMFQKPAASLPCHCSS